MLFHMKSCLFCQIVEGTLPAHTVYEDDLCIAFLDIYPMHPGHVLIIPKRHATDLFSLTSEERQRMMEIAERIAVALKTMDGIRCDGVHLLMNNGKAAAQTVFHSHLHVIPRHKGDKLNVIAKISRKILGPLNPKASEKKLSVIAEQIRQAMV